MKEALSLRYGGELVPATECDYRSFRDLGLLCPICRKTVFLVSKSERSEHERKTKGGEKVAVKGSCIPAHFNHHPGTESSMVELCELRSSQITPAQRLAVVAKARGQRQKIFSRHFWRIISSSYRMIDAEHSIECFDMLFVQQFGDVASRDIKYEIKINSIKSGLLKEIRHAYNLKNQYQTREGLLSMLETLHTDDRVKYLVEKTGDTSIANIYRDDMGELEKRLKVEVIVEAALFLGQARQSAMLDDLIKLSIFIALAYATSRGDAERLSEVDSDFGDTFQFFREGIDPSKPIWNNLLYCIAKIPKLQGETWDIFVRCIITEIDMILCTVDWAGKFAEFEKDGFQ